MDNLEMGINPIYNLYGLKDYFSEMNICIRILNNRLFLIKRYYLLIFLTTLIYIIYASKLVYCCFVI